MAVKEAIDKAINVICRSVGVEPKEPFRTSAKIVLVGTGIASLGLAAGSLFIVKGLGIEDSPNLSSHPSQAQITEVDTRINDLRLGGEIIDSTDGFVPALTIALALAYPLGSRKTEEDRAPISEAEL